MMASYDATNSIEVYRFKGHDLVGLCNSNQSLQSPIGVVSSLDLESVGSRPGINRNASMNSATSQWSTATTQASNTSKRRSEMNYRKQKFHHFVKILMGIVKEKDEQRFQTAKAVICDCEEQKRRGEIESLSESLRCPLKDAVGPRFWSEARKHQSHELSNSKTKRSSSSCVTTEADVPAPDAIPLIQNEEGFSQSSSMEESKTCCEYNDTTATMINEINTRKKRLWMIIRVFMQSLRRRHYELYRKAHALVNECVREHGKVRHLTHCNSLSGRIQDCLKKEFGLEHWKRAEHFVAKILRAHQENRR